MLVGKSSVNLPPGINRYIVGCKYPKPDNYPLLAHELIDTQWDVNTDLKDNSANADTELIDTQWDVNVNKRENIIFGIVN